MPERPAMDDDSSAGIERVGIAGWGRMGAGIGRHLIAGGVEVMAYDPAGATRASMLEGGEKPADSVAELSASNDLVLVIVVDDAQARGVLALTGGERGAEQESLRLMCGGPEAVIDRCRPTLGVDMPLTESLIPLMEELTAEQLRALR